MMKFIVTWWAWFIWSVIVKYLNEKWMEDIIIVDNLDNTEKWKNLVWKKYINYFDKSEFLGKVIDWEILEKDDIVIHMWACSSTNETDSNYIMENNSKYTKKLFDECQKVWARLIYASSAATYWDWSKWYSDENFDLEPLNAYGYSKHLLDQWLIKETNDFNDCKNQVVWLKFFNVYWPNEYHKWSMASMVYHGYNQIKQDWKIWLFKSYREDYKDGMQSRDFIYVKDIAKVIWFMIEHPEINWIFNLWTWESRTFYDLAKATFSALWLEPNIYFKDMPETLKNKYQYYTKADMWKLRSVWYNEDSYTLEEWVKDYVTQYLDKWIKTY